jgi:hypothetical protein
MVPRLSNIHELPGFETFGKRQPGEFAAQSKFPFSTNQTLL